ncbi:MAG: hypothetical protein NZ749_04365 [bacterium]|nr:hypothetical protein [bacterium]
MRTRALLFLTFTLATAGAVLLGGCGGSSNVAGSRGAGDLVIAVNWGNSRVIPPEAVRIDVSVSGEGLPEPVTAAIIRPESQTVIRNLPAGFKQVVGEAKDSAGRVVARGTGNTRIEEGARASVRIVMTTTPPEARRVLVRTTQGGVARNVEFVAFQDGDGRWQALSGTGGEYRFEVADPNGRYGVVIVCLEPEGPHVRIIHATQAEIDQLTVACEATASTATVSGAVRGLAEGEGAAVFMAQSSAFWDRLARTYRLERVPHGTHDLIALVQGFMQPLTPSKMFIRRNLNIGGNTSEDVDFASGEAFTPEERTATVVGGNFGAATITFRSANGTIASAGGPWYGGDIPFFCVPLSRQTEGDIHIFSVQSEYRQTLRYFKAPSNLNLTLPAQEFSTPEVEVAGTEPYLRLRTTGLAYSGAQAYVLDFLAPTLRSRQGGGSVQWTVLLTSAWLGTNSSYTLPDLSGLLDWNNAWGIAQSARLSWSATAVASNRSLLDTVRNLLQGQHLDGLEIRRATRTGAPVE